MLGSSGKLRVSDSEYPGSSRPKVCLALLISFTSQITTSSCAENLTPHNSNKPINEDTRYPVHLLCPIDNDNVFELILRKRNGRHDRFQASYRGGEIVHVALDRSDSERGAYGPPGFDSTMDSPEARKEIEWGTRQAAVIIDRVCPREEVKARFNALANANRLILNGTWRED